MPDTQPPALDGLISATAELLANLIPDQVGSDRDLLPFRLAFSDAALDRSIVVENTLAKPGVRDYADEAVTLIVGGIDEGAVKSAADRLVAAIRVASASTRDDGRHPAQDAIARELDQIWTPHARRIEQAILTHHRLRRLH